MMDGSFGKANLFCHARIDRRAATLRLYFDGRPNLDLIKEIDHITVAHSHAAQTRRSSEERFGVRPMDVNVPRIGVAILGIQSVEPEDPRLHMIMFVPFLSEAPGLHTADKNFSRRSILTVFFRDAKPAARRLVTALLRPDSETRCRNHVASQQSFAVEQIKGLGWDMDADLH